MNTLNLYIVKREDGVDWDEFDSVVVKAKNEINALKIAVDFYDYFSEEKVTVKEIHLDDEEGIVHKSFVNG